jgi:aminopeptidase-like protein
MAGCAGDRSLQRCASSRHPGASSRPTSGRHDRRDLQQHDLRSGSVSTSDLAEPATIARGELLHSRMAELYPICRSITGGGLRQTLRLIGEQIPIEVRAVKSGTQVFDWTINDEWNVQDAYIADLDGRRLVDFRAHNLHLVNYSVPVRDRLSFEELRPHLHTLPDHPDWIPYRTSYYSRNWGFCLSQAQLDRLGPGPFDVVVDSTLGPGELNYGELVIEGDTDDEMIISSHVCHPSLANDNLSGITVATELAKALLAAERRRYTYRFLFAPGTIGSITWLSEHPDVWSRIRHGLVLTGLGGGGRLVYKRTRHGSRLIDRAAAHVVERAGGEVRDYSPYGYDERQFNSVGFDLPVGRLSRTPHNEYPEYHTSADNLDFVTAEELGASYSAVWEIIQILERDRSYRNLSPYGEPQLGKRGLYPTMGGKAASDAVMAMLWTLGYSDGNHSALDIAEVSGLDFTSIDEAVAKLVGAQLLEPA